MQMTKQITDARGLEEAVASIAREPWIALDTEFMRERTYFAQLCLIQIATGDTVFIIDPLAIGDIAPLVDVLYRETPIKVLHSARQDLELLYDLRNAAPPAIFDTQIAAGFLGYDDQIGYANLVSAVTGTVLAKTQTRTNWAARPLSAEQLVYAADDVLHLRRVYEVFVRELQARGRYEWAVEECARLSDDELYAVSLDRVHLRIKQGHLLPAGAQHRLRALAIWRERTARVRDLPRSWVLSDADLMALAQTSPQDLAAAIGATPAARPWQEELLAVLPGPEAPDPARAYWPTVTRWDSEQNKSLARLNAIVRNCAAENKISATLLATRRDLESLLSGARDVAALRGWRRPVIGERLLAALSAA